MAPLRQVVKKYGDVEAVRAINLDIPNNEFVVLVGPSGCGKSTTLRVLAGLEEITSGDISIGGQMVNDLPPKDRDIAMVFQNYALYPHMTAFDNMAFVIIQHLAPQHDALPPRLHRGVRAGHRREQCLGIGVLGVLVEGLAVGDLHDLAEIHHRDAIGDVANH